MVSGRTLKVARLGRVDYLAALELQQALVAARLRDSIDDTLLLLEHPEVFTLGRGADENYLISVPSGVPVYRVSRGGQVTYHGPGQLVGYPILKLQGADRDVILYLRRLEQAMIKALEEGSFMGWSTSPITFPRAEGALWHNWSPPLLVLHYTAKDQTPATAEVAYILGQ